MADIKRADLLTLLSSAGKHSGYQQLAPSVERLLARATNPSIARYERERMRWLVENIELRGTTVLDIGTNIGFFAFSAIEEGALSVDCWEGNPMHAEFVSKCASELGLESRIAVRNRYYTFSDPEPDSREVDIAFCLNVLHHLGADFGEDPGSTETARTQIASSANSLATRCRRLFFQIGFNWKGDRNSPLFKGGTKTEIIDFVNSWLGTHWRTDAIGIAECRDGCVKYQAVTQRNLLRDDSIGEFLNRPLFLLTSRVL